MNKISRTARAFLDSTSHFGGVLSVARKAVGRSRAGNRAVDRVERWMGLYTDYRTRAFDRKYGTDTYDRIPLTNLDVEGALDPRFGDWLYGPINPDFFREMMRALPVALADYGFWDVGAGKGLALLLASDYGFKELVGIEFSPSLVEAGKRNVAIYEQKTHKSLNVEWICHDFMKVDLGTKPQLFFLNSPFPYEIAKLAVAHIEASLAANPRKAIVLYRKPHGETVKQLDACPSLKLLKATPFWRAYTTGI